jgi:RNA polymerase sigma-70 factor, ECF subfamily
MSLLPRQPSARSFRNLSVAQYFEASMATESQVAPSLNSDSDRCASFTRMVVERRAYFLSVARRITLSSQDAEDIVQESILRALDHLDRFRAESRMDTWLHSIVVNTSLSWLRNRNNRAYVPLEPAGFPEGTEPGIEFACPGKSPEECCSDRHLLSLLLAEIRSLDPIYRRPIQACDLAERSYREAAAALGISLCTLKARLFRGRTALKRRLRGLEGRRKRAA